jgi:hypothetical protein
MQRGAMRNWIRCAAVLAGLAGSVAPVAWAQDGGPGAPGKAADDKPDFPPFAEVSKGFDRVVSTADGAPSLYTLWKRDKDARMLAELPRDFGRQKIFIATTIAGGAPNTGIQLGATYAYWRRYDKRLALVEPNVAVRSTGDAESKRSEEKVYTDRVLMDVPIVAMGPGGGPVIDLSGMLVGQAERFFGFAAAGANKGLVKIAKAKAFPKNMELAFELPARNGVLTTLHYSISEIPERGSYQPREADPRVGFFTTSYRDISRQDKDTQWVRYVNRWQLEKRDPKLKMSPPKQPIVFYIEATVPVGYRRWVRDGILGWNKAFEKVGIVDAVQVYQQDAATGEHMDKDPEDVRYNFVRWTSANLGFAIGPSRVHPETGQILDADVVIDDGFLRGWFRSYQQLISELAMTGYGPDVLAWLDKNPQWDPRVRLASPAERELLLQSRQFDTAQRTMAALKKSREQGPESAPALFTLRSGEPLIFNPIGSAQDGVERDSALSGLRCSAIMAKSMDVALMRAGMEALGLIEADMLALAQDEAKKDDDKKDDKKKDAKPKEQMLDGMPESFVGPLLTDLVAHEVGHTLGLRHNFKASSIHTLKEMNSPGFKGSKTITGSVMDYNPININMKDGEVQGDYAMVGIGPYDYWAIEYGYSMDKDLKPILARVSEGELPYGTDEDLSGPDPMIKQFDLGKDSLDYAESTMRLVQFLRPKIIDKLVKDGDSWQKARDVFSLLLGRQVGAVRVAAYYLGGASVNRDRKGDPGNRAPVVPFDMKQQRRALKFIVDNAFKDESFGLDRDLLARLSVDKWWDEGGMRYVFEDPAWPVHDRILGIQASALTMVMNPTTLQRVFDNELRVAPKEDALTLPEVIDTLTNAVFSELDSGLRGGTAREPAISSLRRNLQREYLSRLIDLASNEQVFAAAYKPISNLVVLKLRELKGKIDKAADAGLDPYTKAHLTEASIRIGKALEAPYIYNMSSLGGMGGGFFFFGEPAEAGKPRAPGSAGTGEGEPGR